MDGEGEGMVEASWVVVRNCPGTTSGASLETRDTCGAGILIRSGH